MNKKIITLLALVLIIVVIGIVAYINLGGNNENSNTTQDQASSENQLNNEDVAQPTNGETEENSNQENGSDKTLVLYFSMSGNTERVANFIHEAVGGDIIKLETEQTYPSDYNELVDYAQEEQRENARPTLSTKIDNIDEYDTIFLGYPNWWGDMPMPIYSFLDEYDLSGKTIAPFITHGGSGLSGTPRNIAEEEPDATVTDGLAIRDDDSADSQADVNEWLSEIGF